MLPFGVGLGTAVHLDTAAMAPLFKVLYRVLSIKYSCSWSFRWHPNIFGKQADLAPHV